MIDPNDFEDENSVNPRTGRRWPLRGTAVDPRMEAAKQEIAALKAAADDVAARMAKLDVEADTPIRVRLATLREVSDMLYANGELYASKLVRDVIRKES